SKVVKNQNNYIKIDDFNNYKKKYKNINIFVDTIKEIEYNNLCCSLEQQNNRLTIKLFIFWRNTQVWLKGSVLKTERGVKARGGSNPSSSFQKENLKEIKSLRFFSCFMIKNVLLFPFMVESIDNNK